MSTNFKPTAEQEAICEAARGTQKNLLVRADAGVGKTTTLKLLAGRMAPRPALAIAFNKKIATDLEGALPTWFTVKTLNGLGHGALAKAAYLQGRRLELINGKLGKITSEVFKEAGFEGAEEDWSEVRDWANSARQAGMIHSEFAQRFRGLVEDEASVWDDLSTATAPSADLRGMAREVLRRATLWTFQGRIDFDDQIYASTLLGGVYPQFGLVLVDEAQDLSPLNHLQIKKLGPQARLMIVGDPKQCHPPGTMISLTGGKQKPIEQLRDNDKLVSYNRKVGFSGVNHQGTDILDRVGFPFKGHLVHVETEGPFSCDYTPSHKCMVRWLDKTGHSVYLMRKGIHYRIGVAQNWYNSVEGGFGPSMRARQEGADALWILQTCGSKEEALIVEKVLWTKFGLPDLIFRCSGKASSTQEHLDAAWGEIGDNSVRAYACLEHFHRDPHFPFWRKGDKKHVGGKSFITQACNLISGAMEVKVFDGSANCPTWLPIWVKHVPYEGPVFGLEVGSNGYGLNLYVANGIVTHNCIYAFRGADARSFEKLQALRPADSWLELPLHMTFRCPKIVVERQQGHAPGYAAAEGNPEGRFAEWRKTANKEDPTGVHIHWQGGAHEGWSASWLMGLKEASGDRIAVLCRNNAPLLSLAFKLIRQGIGPEMLGRDIGAGLVKLAKSITKGKDDLDAKGTLELISRWQRDEEAKAELMERTHLIAGIVDRAECLKAVLEQPGVDSPKSLTRAIENLFAREYGEIVLATGHKAKGLEFHIVLHLDPWRIPSRFASKDPAQMGQEMNLKYVIETRTMRTLIEANLEDFV